jgi:hypothetical protein
LQGATCLALVPVHPLVAAPDPASTHVSHTAAIHTLTSAGQACEYSCSSTCALRIRCAGHFQTSEVTGTACTPLNG